MSNVWVGTLDCPFKMGGYPECQIKYNDIELRSHLSRIHPGELLPEIAILLVKQEEQIRELRYEIDNMQTYGVRTKPPGMVTLDDVDKAKEEKDSHPNVFDVKSKEPEFLPKILEPPRVRSTGRKSQGKKVKKGKLVKGKRRMKSRK